MFLRALGAFQHVVRLGAAVKGAGAEVGPTHDSKGLVSKSGLRRPLSLQDLAIPIARDLRGAAFDSALPRVRVHSEAPGMGPYPCLPAVSEVNLDEVLV